MEMFIGFCILASVYLVVKVIYEDNNKSGVPLEGWLFFALPLYVVFFPLTIPLTLLYGIARLIGFLFPNWSKKIISDSATKQSK